MCSLQVEVEVIFSRRVYELPIPEIGEDPRLIEDGPGLDTVPKSPDYDIGVLCESTRCIAVRPATFVFESLRKIPMIERA
jgi:hypothetical protein